MGRKKRSETEVKQAEAVAAIEKAEAKPAPKVREYRQALCPVCGRAAGRKRLEYPKGGYWSPPATENFWEYTQDFDPNKPFGVIQEVGAGKGHSFKVLGYFNPEDDVDGFFPLVKRRLLNAVKEWLDKGWLTKEEVADLIAAPSPR